MRAALLALLAAPAWAQPVEVMAPEEFLAFAEGRTLSFAGALDGASYGTEQFLGGGRTRYLMADGTCAPGTVTVRGEAVCFAYPTDPAETCWRTFRQGDRVLARSTGPGVADIVEVTGVSDDPVTCEAAPNV